MIAIFDLEGTLSNSAHREPLRIAGEYDSYNEQLIDDPPRGKIIGRLKNIFEAGIEVVILTCKPERYREDVLYWLNKNKVPYDIIVMRKEGDYRSSPEIKEEFVLVNRSLITHAFEDRDDVIAMYKKHGITCIKVKNE